MKKILLLISSIFLMFSIINSFEHISSFYPNRMPKIIKYYENNNYQLELVKELGYYDNGKIKYDISFQNNNISAGLSWSVDSFKSKNIAFNSNNKIVGIWKYNVNEIKIDKMHEMESSKDTKEGFEGFADLLILPMIDIFDPIGIIFTLEGNVRLEGIKGYIKNNLPNDFNWIYKNGDYYLIDKKNNREEIIKFIDNSTILNPTLMLQETDSTSINIPIKNLYRQSFYY